tara:strand:- start:417 stop:665 length:249 start_codon:yes stop_codon:yes gene_type:complete
MSKNKNWMIINNRGDVTELIGIYTTKRAAEFIAKKLKITNPKITPTEADVFPKNNRVDEFLEMRNNVIASRQRVIQYLPKKG